MPTFPVSSDPVEIEGMKSEVHYHTQCQGASPIHIKFGTVPPQITESPDIDLECHSINPPVTAFTVPALKKVYAWVDSGDSVIAFEPA